MGGAKRVLILAATAALGMFSAFGLLLFGIVGLVILVVATLGTLGNSVRQAVGSAQVEAFAQPLLWLPYAQANAQGIPTALIMSVMKHESRGNLFAQNYNCNNGKAAGTRCSTAYKPALFQGPIHTLSVDAGLMQINSANWPTPNVPGWTEYHLWNQSGTENPFVPGRNIAAGATKLAWDLKTYKTLGAALYAYNGGTPQNGQFYDPGYAPAVEANLQQYLSGPTVFAWSAYPAKNGVYTLPASGGEIETVAAFPHGGRFTLNTSAGPLQGRDLIPPKRVEADLPGTPSDTCGFPCKHPVPENDFNLSPVTATDAQYGVYPGAHLWAAFLRPGERVGNGPALRGNGVVNDLTVTATWIWYKACGKNVCRYEAKASAPLQVVFKK